MSIFDDIGNFFDGGNGGGGNTVDSQINAGITGGYTDASGNWIPLSTPNGSVGPDGQATDVSGGPVYDPTSGVYTQPATQPPFNGTVSINQGGAQVSGGVLDTILNDTLSALAIFRGAKYVPTTAQPVNQYASSINPATGIPYQAGLVNAGSTGASIGATAESFIRNNTGILLIAGAAFLLLQMKPVSRR